MVLVLVREIALQLESDSEGTVKSRRQTRIAGSLHLECTRILNTVLILLRRMHLWSNPCFVVVFFRFLFRLCCVFAVLLRVQSLELRLSLSTASVRPTRVGACPSPRARTTCGFLWHCCSTRHLSALFPFSNSFLAKVALVRSSTEIAMSVWALNREQALQYRHDFLGLCQKAPDVAPDPATMHRSKLRVCTPHALPVQMPLTRWLLLYGTSTSNCR